MDERSGHDDQDNKYRDGNAQPDDFGALEAKVGGSCHEPIFSECGRQGPVLIAFLSSNPGKTLFLCHAWGMARSNEFPPTAPTKAVTPPPHASLLAGWALVPLRAFLGITFIFASLQKLANPGFFTASNPASIQAQLIASEHFSPIGALNKHLVGVAVPVGIAIALGELAIGIGCLLGFWTRIAALGGLALSFMLFLTVSFHAHPYFTGADIVFVFAWTPFVIAGSGGVWSLDQYLAQRRANDGYVGDVSVVATTFASLAASCVSNAEGACTAQRKGTACGPDRCPVLRGGVETKAVVAPVATIDRRSVVIASSVAAGSVVLAGAAAGIGRMFNNAGNSTANNLAGGTTTTVGSAATTTTNSANGTLIGAASKVPVGSAASFTLPSGDPGIVIHTSADTYECFDAVCTHAGCTVGYSGGLIMCPCHGSTFSATTGSVIGGPAPTGLKKYTVKDVNGDLYLQA